MAFNYKKYIKRISKWAMTVVFILLLFMGVLFGLIQTEWGKRQLERRVITGLMSDSNIRVQAVGLSGLLPFHVRLEHMVIADHVGDWLRVEDIHLRWSPLALLKGRYHINKLHIAAVHLERVPFSKKEEKDRQFEWSRWTAHMTSLVLEDFSLQNLSLGESLLAERANFTIRGVIRTEEVSKAVKGFWHMERKDGPLASALIHWTLEGKDPLLTIDAAVKEEEGRLSRALLGIEDTGAVFIELKGQGPVKAWKGQLHAKGEYIGALESRVEFGTQKDFRLKGDGYITLNSTILPPQVAPLLRDARNHFTWDVRYNRSGVLNIHGIDYENDRFDLRLEGDLDLQKEMMSVEFTWEVADISFLNEIIDSRVKGRAVMEGHISGSLREPHSILSLSLFEPEVGEFYASRVTSDLEFEVNGKWLSSFQGLSIRSKGNAIGLAYSNKRMILPETRVQWSVAAEVKKNMPITLSELALSSGDLLLRFSGALNPAARSLKGETLIDIGDFKPLSGLFNTALSGSGRLQAQLEVDGQSRSVSAEIKGQVGEVGPFTPLLTVFLGQGVDYTAHAELVNSSHLKISGLRARSSSAELSGDISVNLSTKKTTGQGTLSIPRLSVLNEPINRNVSGSLTLDMQIEGTWLDPTLNIQAKGHRLGTEEILLEHVTMSLQAMDFGKDPRGHLDLELRQTEYPLKAESDFLWERDRLILSNAAMRAAEMEATGGLSIDLQNRTGEGSLQGKSDNITRFSNFLGEAIDGSVLFKAFLSSREKKQDLALDVQANGLEGRFGKAAEFSLELRLKDLFGTPNGTAEARVESFHRGELDLKTLAFSAEGGMRKASFSGNAVGHYRRKFQFQTRGEIDLSESDANMRVDLFQGQFSNYDYKLLSSAFIHRKAHELVLESAAFLLDKGRFVASGRLGVEDISFDARLDGLPAEVMNLIIPIEFTGSANGHLQITGQLNRPQAFMEFSVDDMRFKGAAFEGLPHARFSTRILFEEDKLQADLSLEGLFEKPFRADVQVPAKISLRPLNFSLKAEEEIHGRVSADLDLSLIPAFFYLEDQRLSGRLWVDITLAGGAESPEVKGKVGLSDGSYENLRSGTILRDVQITAECEQNRIILTDAHGTDGGSGTFSAQGWLQLFSLKGFPFQWDFALNSATLVRRDDLTFLTSGNLTFSGTPRETLLSGTLTLGPAEIRIPDRFPSEVPDLEVVEINRTDQWKTEMPAEKEPANGWNLDLRLEAPGRVFVRGRGLDSEWKGELHLMGNTEKPSLTGVLSVIRGRYDFLGKPFSVTSGNLNFGGLSPPSPILDFSAENKHSDMTVNIRLSGFLTSLDVLMDSEPPLPADEILSRLLFNRGLANISPIQALQLGQALNAFTGSRSPFDVTDRTRRILHVDQLDIKQSDEENGGTSVSIGKYLTDNVYVEIEKGVGTDGGRISSELELTPNLTFESETGTDAHVGVGLNWKWDY
jgi:translocation and assembly module TamB